MITCGVDVGSLSTKAVILRDGEIIASNLILTTHDSVESSGLVLEQALKNAALSFEDIDCTVATGYGRVNVPASQFTVSEISCHAKGSHWLFQDVRTILDMGGQDCKAIRCSEGGKVIDFVMNDKCAAGTGRYLERISVKLDFPLEEIGEKSLQVVEEPCHVTSTCAVFAEGEILNLIREGKHYNDILAGATDALIERIGGLLDRVGVERELCISGGVAKNIGVVKRVEKRYGLKARIPPGPQLVGALGAALFAVEKNRTRLREGFEESGRDMASELRRKAGDCNGCKRR